MPIDCQRNSHTLVSSQKVISVGINAARPRRKNRRKSWVKLSRAPRSRVGRGSPGTAPAGSGLGSLGLTTTSIHSQKAKINSGAELPLHQNMIAFVLNPHPNPPPEY